MGLFTSILKSLGPRKRRKKRRRPTAVRAESSGGFRPSEGGSEGKILVASLFGAGGVEVSERIVGMLAQESTFQNLRLEKVLKQNLRLGLVERLLLANEEGARWLKEEKADLLIWGQMEDMGTVASLQFSTLIGSTDSAPGSFGMAETLDMPVPLPDKAGDVVRAAATAALLPATRGSKRGLAHRLAQLLAPATEGFSSLPKNTPVECMISMHNIIGNAYATSVRYGNKKAAAGAIEHYEKANALLNADTLPMMWAVIQTHWASVLEAEARTSKSPDALQAAIARYGAVTDTLGRDEHGHDWALAHVRRALGLYKLATMVPERASGCLKEAASAFEEALTVYDRTQMPARWAEVMNHYGVTQMALGGYGAGEAVLQQSVTTFRKVLEVRRREAGPLLWAQTSNNLGAACFALAKKSKEDHLLEEAATCFQGAMEVYRVTKGQKKRAEVIQKNLMRVQHLLADDAA